MSQTKAAFYQEHMYIPAVIQSANLVGGDQSRASVIVFHQISARGKNVNNVGVRLAGFKAFSLSGVFILIVFLDHCLINLVF